MKKLILLAGALLAVAAFNSPVRADDKDASRDANRPADQQTAQDNGSLDSHDAGFVRALHQGNLTEVKTAELAKKQANSSEAKNVADRMIADHKKADEDVKNLAKNKNITLSNDLDAKNQADYDRLAKLNGDEFDRAYLSGLIKDHEEDVDKAKEFSKVGKDDDVKALADKCLPTFQEHLRMVKDANDRVTGSAAGTASEKQGEKSSEKDKSADEKSSDNK